MKINMLWFSIFGMLLIQSCGNSSTEATEESGGMTGAKLVASTIELPDCDSSSIGQLFYILKDKEFQVCAADGYSVIDLTGATGSTGADGVGCLATKSNDSLFIDCDGVIDTIVDGSTGAKGVGCLATKSNDSLFIDCDGVIDTIVDGSTGAKGVGCLATKSNDSLFIDCDGVIDTIVDGSTGASGADGSSIEWLGSLSEKPANPKLNQAFYWGGISCIWDGDSWELLSKDGGIPATTCEYKFTATTFADPRDGQEYKWVRIGAQIWMAENLNYETSSGSYCYSNKTVNCDTYGRLYTWSAAMDGAASSSASPSGIQGVCPTDWHLPSNAEWTELINYVDANNGSDGVGTSLKANSSLWSANAGTDAFGFSGLPGGLHFNSVSHHVGNFGFWWSSTEYDSSEAYRLSLGYNSDDFFRRDLAKSYAFSVRCIRDIP